MRMKPRITKRGKNRDKTVRYCLEFINASGEFKIIILNPVKLKGLLEDKPVA